jgi:hypothetical protein
MMLVERLGYVQELFYHLKVIANTFVLPLYCQSQGVLQIYAHRFYLGAHFQSHTNPNPKKSHARRAL